MKIGTDLCSHPLLSKLETCDFPDTFRIALQQEIPGFDVPGNTNSDNKKLTKWLDPTIKVLIAFSSIIGGGVSLASTMVQVRLGNWGTQIRESALSRYTRPLASYLAESASFYR
jgi:hypothetical protein